MFELNKTRMRIAEFTRILFLHGIVLTGIVCVLLFAFSSCGDGEKKIFNVVIAALEKNPVMTGLTIDEPLDNTLFPPDIAAYTFAWSDETVSAWALELSFLDDEEPMCFLLKEKNWTPGEKDWATIVQRARGTSVSLVIAGFAPDKPNEVLTAGRISFSFSADKVSAPIFYREVNLPFSEAVKDPSHIRWRLGSISSRSQPPIVLENMPVCANCHSFSADGETLGMDVDYANDKGSYAIAPVVEEMVLSKDKIITWSDYKRDDEEDTFGLLSRVSPDGRYVIGTVKDKSVFIGRPELAFSQLFFPIQGILVLYDRETKTFHALSGADDPQFVQSNPVWSPDGKQIVFARGPMYELKTTKSGKMALMSEEQCMKFITKEETLQYDLYRVPFNGGKGGKAEPLCGASNNGMSNYFAKYSPDGKWIIFCRAASFMLLMPDSELYIIPAQGGEARRLECNTNRMNSWHTWSPNSRWLAFSSKKNSVYTQLFLTHIDAEGHSSPPLVLSRFTSPDKAANIPEFLNSSPSAIRKISEQFLNDVSLVRAGIAHETDFASAEKKYREALALNLENAEAHGLLGVALSQQNRHSEAFACLNEAIRLAPQEAKWHYNLALTQMNLKNIPGAIEQYRYAVQFDPDYGEAYANLGVLLLKGGEVQQAMPLLVAAARLKPDSAETHYWLGYAKASLRMSGEAAKHFREALRLNPDHIDALVQLGVMHSVEGRNEEAIKLFRKATEIAPSNANAHYGMGVALEDMERFDDALGAFHRASELNPTNTNFHFKIILTHMSMGNVSAGLQAYKEALADNPAIARNPIMLDQLAFGFAKAGLQEEATQTAKQALTLARKAGNAPLAAAIVKHLDQYREK